MPESPSLLHALHETAGAEFQRYEPVEIVSTFGNVPAEYSAIRKSAAKMDLPQRGILEAAGKDRLDFLNRMLTNQTFDRQTKMPMAAGHGVYAFLLNSKGRIAADMNILEIGDRTFLEMDARLVDPTRVALDKYQITDDVKLTSRIGSLHEIAGHGPQAPAALGLTELKPLESAAITVGGIRATAFRDDPCGVPGYFLIMPADSAAAVWHALVPRPIGWAAFNAVRVEAGRPLMGIDFDESVLPAETGPATLARAVSFTKGGYLGQEIVARMPSRGQFSRQLVGIRMENDALPVAGSI